MMIEILYSKLLIIIRSIGFSLLEFSLLPLEFSRGFFFHARCDRTVAIIFYEQLRLIANTRSVGKLGEGRMKRIVINL